jgi:hypothetical protein
MKVFDVYTNNSSSETARNSRKQQAVLCWEWRNIKTIVSQAADNGLG